MEKKRFFLKEQARILNKLDIFSFFKKLCFISHLSPFSHLLIQNPSVLFFESLWLQNPSVLFFDKMWNRRCEKGETKNVRFFFKEKNWKKRLRYSISSPFSHLLRRCEIGDWRGVQWKEKMSLLVLFMNKNDALLQKTRLLSIQNRRVFKEPKVVLNFFRSSTKKT
jgi:hypothetical protein